MTPLDAARPYIIAAAILLVIVVLLTIRGEDEL